MPSTFCCDCRTSKQHQFNYLPSSKAVPESSFQPCYHKQGVAEVDGPGTPLYPRVHDTGLGHQFPLNAVWFFSAMFSNQSRALFCLAKRKWRCIPRVRGGRLDRSSGNHLQLWDCTGSDCTLACRPKRQFLNTGSLNSEAFWNTSSFQYKFYTEK